MSGDSDVNVLWYAIQSEPGNRAMTEIYFIIYTFLVIHVLINVFVAVFANIFAETRAEHEEMIDMRRKGMQVTLDLSQYEDSSSGTSSSSSERSSLSASSASSVPSDQVEVAEVKETKGGVDGVTRTKYTKDQIGDVNEEGIDELQRQFRIQKLQMLRLEEEEAARKYVGTRGWIDKYLETKIDPSLQSIISRYLRNNDYYDLLCFLVTGAQGASLALLGQLCTGDCTTDQILGDIVQNSNYFFIIDLLAQIMCDGSLGQHFESGENIFNGIVTFFTTMGLVLNMFGLDQNTIAVFRGMAILRLLRSCKFWVLKPIWLMLVKACGALLPVMNLCLFNTLLAIIYYSVGRSMFQDALSDDLRYNYSSMSRGYMLLLTVLSGDGWSSYQYDAMFTFCSGDKVQDSCDNFYVTITAFFYMVWYFYGQFLFITMFLAIILEAFSVEEFMTKAEIAEEDVFLDRENAIQEIAEFQRIPDWHVHPGLIKLAFLKLGDGGKVSQNKLMTLVRMVQPKSTWRFMKASGIIKARFWLRNSICSCFANSWLKSYPGDEDFIRTDEETLFIEMNDAEAELEVAKKMARQIKTYMQELVAGGMIGEVLVIGKIKNILEYLDPTDLPSTEPFIALKVLRHESISKRLDIGGLYDSMIEDMRTEHRNKHFKSASKNLDNQAEFVGLDVSKLDDGSEKLDVRNDDSFVLYQKKFRRFAVTLVESNLFNLVMFSTIVVSSAFLCLEPPHESIPGPVPNWVLRLANIIFNILFSVEFIAKSTAFGFYTPRSVQQMSYMQVGQNQVDLFILALAIADMSGAGEYIGANTTKVIRLMKVMRPVRLLLRSEGLKAIIEALFASLKPMAYATLFVLILCTMFSVTGMAFFRNRFHACSDLSLDGMLGQGQIECSGSYLDLDKGKLFLPRSWKAPPWGSNFDTLGSSIMLLVRVLTLSWSTYYVYAQDAVSIGVQPVMGYSLMQASLFFHLFILVGSFFGLNLFASFMCDTFYSLQGTAQLEEVQWMAVKALLKQHQPKKNRSSPKNIFSTFLREVLGSYWWQNFSAFCLLLNVTFMGSSHSSQDSYFDNFLDVQNTVFFGLMCGEAGLHLLSVGPVLYVLNRGNQFDLFLISATSATILFADSLRSLSQVTRILRLFKFLRALAKDKTIANVFETVLVSMGQVTNILIVLIILIVMLGVLAVQVLGTVRPGQRLGLSLLCLNLLPLFCLCHCLPAVCGVGCD